MVFCFGKMVAKIQIITKTSYFPVSWRTVTPSHYNTIALKKNRRFSFNGLQGFINRRDAAFFEDADDGLGEFEAIGFVVDHFGGEADGADRVVTGNFDDFPELVRDINLLGDIVLVFLLNIYEQQGFELPGAQGIVAHAEHEAGEVDAFAEEGKPLVGLQAQGRGGALLVLFNFHLLQHLLIGKVLFENKIRGGEDDESGKGES